MTEYYCTLERQDTDRNQKENRLRARIPVVTILMQRDIFRLTSAELTGIIMLCLTNTKSTAIGRYA
jgi:hypothetical protein